MVPLLWSLNTNDCILNSQQILLRMSIIIIRYRKPFTDLMSHSVEMFHWLIQLNISAIARQECHFYNVTYIHTLWMCIPLYTHILNTQTCMRTNTHKHLNVLTWGINTLGIMKSSLANWVVTEVSNCVRYCSCSGENSFTISIWRTVATYLDNWWSEVMTSLPWFFPISDGYCIATRQNQHI